MTFVTNNTSPTNSNTTRIESNNTSTSNDATFIPLPLPFVTNNTSPTTSNTTRVESNNIATFTPLALPFVRNNGISSPTIYNTKRIAFNNAPYPSLVTHNAASNSLEIQNNAWSTLPATTPMDVCSDDNDDDENKEATNKKKKSKKKNKKKKKNHKKKSKRIKCKCCGKSFKDQNQLNQHLRRKRDEKNGKNKCKYCIEKYGESKSYSSSSNLKEHLCNIHQDADSINYRCPYCNKGYYNIGHFTTHVARGKAKGGVCERVKKYKIRKKTQQLLDEIL